MIRIPFNPEERSRQKQASRELDARALVEDDVNRARLKDENGAFAFPRKRLRIAAFR